LTTSRGAASIDQPAIIEPEALAARLDPATGDSGALRLIHVADAASYEDFHLPGALLVEPRELVDGTPPASGRLPSLERLEALFGRLGYDPNLEFILYDDEGGGWAGRFAWTLDVIGHPGWAYLNGGIHAWADWGGPLERGIWDVRSREEYLGLRSGSARAGHIPGAKHLDWLRLKDPARATRLAEDLRGLLAEHGIDPERPTITHCQTHHRSGLSYMVGRLLGFRQIRAYHGSWSEWGNRDDLPVSTES
jgi:thiosulfate/3-mercaptopyruvate sulfurtransferase